jgi:cytosine permease
MAKDKLIETKAFEQIDSGEKQSWLAIAFIWIGIMICIPLLMVGATLSNYFSIGTVVVIALIGYLACSIILFLSGCLGSDLGVPSVSASAKGFGTVGTRVIVSLLNGIVCIGWFGIQAATCGLAFSGVLQIIGVEFPVWASSLIWGIIMLMTAVMGFSWMKWLNYIACPLLFIVCIYALVVTGSSAIPAPSMAGQMTFAAAISTALATMIGGTLVASDYSRYAKKKSDVFKSSIIGVLPAGMFMFFVGARISGSSGGEDIVGVFANMGLPLLSMIVLILATWTTNTGNIYSAGLAVLKIVNGKDSLRPVVTAIAGVAGTLLAMAGILNAFMAVLTLLGGLIPSCVGVIICDYWIVGRGNKKNWRPLKGFNWLGVAAWAIGSVVALKFSFFSPAFDGIIVSIVAYIILAKIGKNYLDRKIAEADDPEAPVVENPVS